VTSFCGIAHVKHPQPWGITLAASQDDRRADALASVGLSIYALPAPASLSGVASVAFPSLPEGWPTIGK